MAQIFSEILSCIDVLHKKARANMENSIRELGLSFNEFLLLDLLRKSDGQITQIELASEMKIDKALVTRGIVSLEEKGFIARDSNPSCRRKKRIELTAQTEELFPALKQIHQASLQKIFAGMSSDELDMFRGTLEKLINNLD